MSYQIYAERLAEHEVVILDGGVGTELQRRGIAMLPGAWSGTASIDSYSTLVQVHKDYIAAGADVITTNTFSTNRILLTESGLENRFEDINKAAIAAAHQARKEAGREDVLVAGSVSHMCPIIPQTTVTDLNKLPPTDRIREAFAELAALHESEGCDLVLLEMMYCKERVPLAFEAAQATGLPVWAGFSARAGENETVLSFDQNRDLAFREILSVLDDYTVDVAGVMHTSANLTENALLELRPFFPGPLMAYPDSGWHAMPNWQFEEIIPPEELEAFAAKWLEQGAQVLGGCCGLAPDHIRALAAMKLR